MCERMRGRERAGARTAYVRMHALACVTTTHTQTYTYTYTYTYTHTRTHAHTHTRTAWQVWHKWTPLFGLQIHRLQVSALQIYIRQYVPHESHVRTHARAHTYRERAREGVRARAREGARGRERERQRKRERERDKRGIWTKLRPCVLCRCKSRCGGWHCCGSWRGLLIC